MSKASLELAILLNDFTADHDKFEEKGSSAAGARARKALQAISHLCKKTRVEIQEAKKAAKAA